MSGGMTARHWLGLSTALGLSLAACGGNDPAAHNADSNANSSNPANAIAAHCPALDPAEFRWIAGGTFTKGDDAHLPEESGPARVTLAGFWLGSHEVTRGEFAEFVRATAYVTIAERTPPAFPNAPADMQKPGSAVFTVPIDGNPNWWRWVVGANWRQPSGPTHGAKSPDLREPVVQIAYDDALAYAKWRGMALPSEDQWEWAARSGGADPDAPPQQTANVYQGQFPFADQGRDGFTGRAPVGCFPADKNGVYDLIGNVWEWTSDSAKDGDNAPAAKAADSMSDSDQSAAPAAPRNVIKGGSFLCASNYCARYRPAARQFQERSLGTDHIGFRLIDPTRPPPP
jgi:formylglycine-generating enzyme